MIQIESLKTTCAVVASKICFADHRGSSRKLVMRPASLRGRSKRWVSELSISLKKFSPQQKIDSSPAIFSGLCSSRSSRFIQEAAARKKTALWKIGSRCFQEPAVSRTPKANKGATESFHPLSSSPGSGQITDRAIGTRVERSRCPFRKKFTAASPGGGA